MQTKDLLDCSQDVLRAEKALEVQYEEYYEQLADQQSLSPEEQAALRSDVTREVEMLEDASSCLRQAHQWASDKADELTTRLREGQESSQRKGLFRRAPANSVIDLEEEQADSFASGVNFYKVALICIAGSFAGVVVEILWCLFRNGYIESRSGLVYGPFNPVYGIGAVIMTLTLYRYRNRSSSISFFGGAVVGSVIEYLLSWGQETLFGSTSWDYSRMPFNLDGRICLLYSLFWGILGVLWIKSLYPRVAQVILKIPNRFGKVLTWVLTIFMVFDCAMSLLAVDRWSERVRGETPVSAVDVFFDEHFPDSRMERIYQGQDWGWYPDPKAFIRAAYIHNTETIYLLDELGGCKIRNSKMAEDIKEKGYDDYEIRCGADEQESIVDFRDAGLPARQANVGPGSVKYTFEWLQCRTIVIDPARTPRAYKEIIEYEHEVDSNGEVIADYPDHNNHWIDALRYATSPLSMRRGNSA